MTMREQNLPTEVDVTSARMPQHKLLGYKVLGSYLAAVIHEDDFVIASIEDEYDEKVSKARVRDADPIKYWLAIPLN